jgi:hypothetical protein
MLIANAGTPLMWAGCCHLIIGNAILGMFEGWLLTKFFKNEQKSFLPMIWANYASMAGGILLVAAATPLRADVMLDPLGRAPGYIAMMWIAAFIITGFIEWPFVAKMIGLKVGKKSLVASFALQTISYIALIPLVFFIGSMSALTLLDPAPAKEISKVDGWVYYAGLDDVTVYRTRIDGSLSETVMTMEKPIADGARLAIEPTAEGDTVDLTHRYSDDDRLILKGVGTVDQAAPVREGRTESGFALLGYVRTRSFVDQPKVICNYWPRLGMDVDDRRYALETPFLQAGWRSSVVLPDGKIVVQFGKAIMLIDPETEKAAKIAEGYGGDVLLDP